MLAFFCLFKETEVCGFRGRIPHDLKGEGTTKCLGWAFQGLVRTNSVRRFSFLSQPIKWAKNYSRESPSNLMNANPTENLTNSYQKIQGSVTYFYRSNYNFQTLESHCLLLTWKQYAQICLHSHPLFLNTSGLAVQESTSHLKFYTVPNG